MKNLLKIALISGVILTGFNTSAMESKGLFGKITAATGNIWKPLAKQMVADYKEHPTAYKVAFGISCGVTAGILSYLGFNYFKKRAEIATKKAELEVLSSKETKLENQLKTFNAKIEGHMQEEKRILQNLNSNNSSLNFYIEGAIKAGSTDALKQEHPNEKKHIEEVEKIIQLQKNINQLDNEKLTFNDELSRIKSKKQHLHYEIFGPKS